MELDRVDVHPKALGERLPDQQTAGVDHEQDGRLLRDRSGHQGNQLGTGSLAAFEDAHG